jgi:tRNA (guanosine-2'-O-)-methyltransferase
MMKEQNKLLLEHFSRFISEHKKDFIDQVLSFRTRHITVVLEDIYQSQNASAVVRTCECMGIQDIHIIEQESKYEINPRVLKGAHKWMTLHRHRTRGVNNVEACFQWLRHNKYRIYVADPSPEGIPIHDLEVGEDRIALIFGNELRGISPYALAHCDEKVRIPMFGFTESLNISVSVAICLNTLLSQMHKADRPVYLSENEKNELKLTWYRKIVRRSELIEKEFLRTIQ